MDSIYGLYIIWTPYRLYIIEKKTYLWIGKIHIIVSKNYHCIPSKSAPDDGLTLWMVGGRFNPGWEGKFLYLEINLNVIFCITRHSRLSALYISWKKVVNFDKFLPENVVLKMVSDSSLCDLFICLLILLFIIIIICLFQIKYIEVLFIYLF